MAKSKLANHTRYTRRNLLLVSFISLITIMTDSLDGGLNLSFIDMKDISVLQLEIIAFFTLLYLVISFILYFEYDFRNSGDPEFIELVEIREKDKEKKLYQDSHSILLILINKARDQSFDPVQIEKFVTILNNNYLQSRIPVVKNWNSLGKRDLMLFSNCVNDAFSKTNLLSKLTPNAAKIYPNNILNHSEEIINKIDQLIFNARLFLKSFYIEEYNNFENKYKNFERAPVFFGCFTLGVLNAKILHELDINIFPFMA